tara:strand:- start:242 stop:427 length:186 start_codon:yes stop_codon:yes gene_type:complete
MNCEHCGKLLIPRVWHHCEIDVDCIETLKQYIQDDLCFVCGKPRDICRGKQLQLDKFEDKE